MRSYEMLRCIERFAELAAGLILAGIRSPELLIPTQPGEMRFWSEKQSGWVRSNLDTKANAPELPGNLLDPYIQMVLLLCMDQASTSHAVAHLFQAPGIQWLRICNRRPFTGHRMIGRSISGMRLAGSNTVLLMIIVYNLPYGPWLHAANISARCEAMAELKKDGRAASVIQVYALGHMASDARRPVPADSAEATAMVEERLGYSGFLREKQVLTSSAWFSSFM